SLTVHGSVTSDGFSGTVDYSDTTDGGYHDSDDGPAGGSDTFDDGDSGDEHMSLTVHGSLSTDTFSGTVDFSHRTDGDYHDSDNGSDTDSDGSVSGSDIYDDGDSADERASLTVHGSVTSDGFSGTLDYSDNSDGDYHESDDGTVGGTSGHDTFDDGDSGD